MTQTLLTLHNGKLLEFPTQDKHSLGDPSYMPGGWDEYMIYGYILNRNSDFKHKFYGWALPRN